jgi:excisionase family DNA binding protein
MTDKPPDILGGLLDQLAAEIASRVAVRVEQLLEQRQSPPDAYRLPEAAKAIGLSTRELRRRIASGELASRRVGKVLLVPREAVTDFLSRTNGSQA